jgi:hypothetical protein
LWVAETGTASVAAPRAAPEGGARLGDYLVVQERNVFNATTKDWRWKWTVPSSTGSTALTYTVKGRVSDEAGHLVESAPVTVTVAGRTSTPLLRPPKPPTFP